MLIYSVESECRPLSHACIHVQFKNNNNNTIDKLKGVTSEFCPQALVPFSVT